MQMLIVEERVRLPTPPSTNHLYAPRIRSVGGRPRFEGMRLTDDADRYREHVKALAAEQLIRSVEIFKAIEEGTSIMEVTIFNVMRCFPVDVMGAKQRFKKIDASGKIKFLEDCVAKALGYDDSRNFVITSKKVPIELGTWDEPFSLVRVRVYRHEFLASLVEEVENEITV